MYRSFSQDAFKQRHNLPDDYSVAGLLTYGSIKQELYETVIDHLASISPSATVRRLPDEFLYPILEITVEHQKYWFVLAYGGALLSEYLHIACLFGSKRNILIGSCGGLYANAVSGDIIVPEYSSANESTTRAYSTGNGQNHYFDKTLSKKLTDALVYTYNVWNGPTITYQAMLAETWDDVSKWSADGYYGVDMEAATVAAVSHHFQVPSAAILRIADNLIKEETVLDEAYQQSKELRNKIKSDIIIVGLRELLS